MKKPTFLPAGRLERFFAFLIDMVILSIPILLVITPLKGTAFVMVVEFVAILSYFTWFNAGVWQATPGQRILSIYVIRTNGGPLTLRDSLERTLAFYLPRLPLYASFIEPQLAQALVVWLSGLWFIPILVRENRMGLHDQLSGTRVVVGKAKGS